MKSKYTIFLVTALLSTVFVDAADEGIFRAPTKPTPPAAGKQFAQKKSEQDFADVLKRILKQSVKFPWVGISGYLTAQIGTDIYRNFFQQYGHHFTDLTLVKRIENAVPRGYGKNYSEAALSLMLGYFAVATMREMLLKAMPEVLGAKAVFNKLTEAARQ